MSTQHTQGRLMVKGGYSLYAGDDTPVADTCLTNSMPANDEANARRLAACWNACDGVPTQALENSDVLAGLSQRIAHLTIQRDELLAALNASRAQWIHSVHASKCLAVIAQAADTPPTAIAPEQLEQAHKLIDEQAAKAIGGKP